MSVMFIITLVDFIIFIYNLPCFQCSIDINDYENINITQV